MIDNLVISKLPYVDGLPEDDTQLSIPWIKNGDPLLGASTNTSNDGQLNMAAVSINKNTVTQQGNIVLTKDKVNELVSNVNNINSILSLSSAGEPISVQVSKNTADISTLKDSVSANATSISLVSQKADSNEAEIGEKPGADTGTRTILPDLYWIKNEIGQYEGEDINGNDVSSNQASGLKYRVVTNTTAIAAQGKRISDLETTITSADINGTKAAVSELRTELGPLSSAGTESVYVRLGKAESSIKSDTDNIDLIKGKIGFDKSKTVDERVTANETSISGLSTTLNADGTGVIDRLESVENQITGTESGTLNKKVQSNTDSITSLNSVVGSSDSEGLRKEVKWIETQIGGDSSGASNPPSTSILGRLTILTSDSNQNASAIQDIQTDIGNNNEGIKGKVNTLSTKMDGTGSGSTIEGIGVFAFSKNLGTTKIDEAPNDGKTYARKSKSWITLASSVASLSLATKTITLTKTDAQINASDFSASAVNTDVTVGTGLTVSSSGTYRIRLDAEAETTSGKIQFTISKGSTVIATLTRYAKDFTDAFIFGSAEEIVKVTSGDVITVTVKALDDASAVSTKLNNIKLSLIPVF